MPNILFNVAIICKKSQEKGKVLHVLILINVAVTYIFHIVYNLLHVMLDDDFIIIWTSDCYVLLVCI